MSGPGTTHDTSAIEQARIAAAGEAGRIPGLSERIEAISPLAGGHLDAGRPLVRAIAELTRAVSLDLVAAGERLQGMDRALDATISSVRELDGAGAGAIALGVPVPGGPVPGVPGPGGG